MSSASKSQETSSDRPLKDHAREVGDSIRNLGTAAYEDARERVSETSTQARDGFDEAVGAVTQQVKSRPLQSMLWTAGAGILVGMLLARRN